MIARPKPFCADAMAWLRANKHALGVLTGQDARALTAIAHCWHLYASCDDDGQKAALGAIRALLGVMQRKCWPLAKELIAHSLDWGDRERLWPLVVPTSDPPTEMT